MIEAQIAAVAVAAFALGVFVAQLAQKRRSGLTARVSPELMPQRLAETVAPATPRTPPSSSPFAPKPKAKPPKPRAPIEPPRRLRHWPSPVPERDKPPAMIEARNMTADAMRDAPPPRPVEPTVLPYVEFGKK